MRSDAAAEPDIGPEALPTVEAVDAAEDRPAMPHRRVARWSAVGLVVLVVALFGYHATWIASERTGFQIDVDESAYLDHAIQASARITAHDPDALRSLYFDEGHPEAPLLSVLTIPFLIAGTPDLQWGLLAQLAVLVVLVVATYLLARRLVGDPWSLLAAAVVACAPGFLDYTRSYQFGVLSAAMLTAAVLCLVESNRFTRWWPALAWGLFVGLTFLSRTMMLALVPGVILAASIAVLVPGPPRWPRLARFGTGLGIAGVVALPWWTANWDIVSKYLTSYGFGGLGNAYGYLYSPTEPLYYLRIPYRVAQELYLPLTLVVFAGVMVCAWAAVGVVRRSGVRPFVMRTIESGHLLLVVVLVADVAALMSSRNKGTGFVLPVIPMLVVLSVLGISRIRLPAARVALVSFIGLTLVADVIMKSGLTSTPFADARALSVSRAEGPILITEGRDRYERYLLPTDYPSDGDVSPQAVEVLDDIAERSRTDYPPVVASQYGDYLFNGNLLGLIRDTRFETVIIWGILQDGTDTVESYAAQLEASAGNAPTEFLVTLDLDPQPAVFPGTANTLTLEDAARSLGFETVATYQITERREARLWQREVPST